MPRISPRARRGKTEREREKRMRLLFHLCMRTARKLIACHNPLTLRLPFPLPLASPDCIISRRETREEEVRISSPTTACPPVHFLRKKISCPFHKFVLTTLSNPFSGFALPVRKRARARARDGAELCGACLCRRCSPLLGRRARRDGEAARRGGRRLFTLRSQSSRFHLASQRCAR